MNRIGTDRTIATKHLAYRRNTRAGSSSGGGTEFGKAKAEVSAAFRPPLKVSLGKDTELVDFERSSGFRVYLRGFCAC